MFVAVLLPTFNEGAALAALLTELRREAAALGGICVYLVDDGGALPIELRELPPCTPGFEIVLARHAINLGQGAALETARQLALARGEHAVFVTMDADGQHRVADLPAMVRAIRDGADAAFGNRFAANCNVPPGRRLVLWLARALEFSLTTRWMSDAHNGYRAFNARALERVRIQQNRMAHATEIRQCLARAGRELRVVEVPVTVEYTRETLRKGQSNLGGFIVLRDLVLNFLFGPE